MRNMPLVIEFNRSEITSFEEDMKEIELDLVREDKRHWIKYLTRGLALNLDGAKFDEIRKAKHEVAMRDETGELWHTIDIFRFPFASYHVCQSENGILMVRLDVDTECLYNEEGHFNERGDYFYNGMNDDDLRINTIRR